MATRKCLLDTNILLTALIQPELLTQEARNWLEDAQTQVYFSAASIWEIAIKCSLGREDFNFLPEDIHTLALETGFEELPVSSNQCYGVATLPWLHRDPFDRLLVAQAQSLPAYLLTSDSLLGKYSELVKRV
jgi:PIN domain nuclease of toxin-antitoxin system